MIALYQIQARKDNTTGQISRKLLNMRYGITISLNDNRNKAYINVLCTDVVTWPQQLVISSLKCSVDNKVITFFKNIHELNKIILLKDESKCVCCIGPQVFLIYQLYSKVRQTLDLANVFLFYETKLTVSDLYDSMNCL